MRENCTDCQEASERGERLLNELASKTQAHRRYECDRFGYRTLCDGHRTESREAEMALRKAFKEAGQKMYPTKADKDYSETRKETR